MDFHLLSEFLNIRGPKAVSDIFFGLSVSTFFVSPGERRNNKNVCMYISQWEKSKRMVAWLDGCTRITEEKLGAELYLSSVTSVKSLAKNEKNENFRQRLKCHFILLGLRL